MYKHTYTHAHTCMYVCMYVCIHRIMQEHLKVLRLTDENLINTAK